MKVASRHDNFAAVRGAAGFALQRRELPALGDGDVRFRVLHAAVCGTDRQIVRGERSDRAAVLGHEGVAEVAAVGRAVQDHAAGDRVVFNPVNPFDQDEILGHSSDGLFQQFLTVPAVELLRRCMTVPAPPQLAAERCVLAEPLGTVLYTHELLQRAGRPASLLIVGAGPIGILHALYAARVARIPRTRIVCNAPARAAWIEQHGVLPAADVVPWNPGRDLGEVDAVLLCTPARATPAALDAALAAIADGGSIALIGGAPCRHVDALPGIDLVELRRANVCGASVGGTGATAAVTRTGKRVNLFGQRGTAARHLLAALDLLAAEPAFASVLTHRVSLAALPEVLPSLVQGTQIAGTHCVKPLVDCTLAGVVVEAIGAIGGPR